MVLATLDWACFWRLRHGVVAAAAPGMAAQDAANGEIEAAQGAVLAEGLKRILRAGGREAAGGRRQGRDESLVEADGGNEDGHQEAREGIQKAREGMPGA